MTSQPRNHIYQTATDDTAAAAAIAAHDIGLLILVVAVGKVLAEIHAAPVINGTRMPKGHTNSYTLPPPHYKLTSQRHSSSGAAAISRVLLSHIINDQPAMQPYIPE